MCFDKLEMNGQMDTKITYVTYLKNFQHFRYAGYSYKEYLYYSHVEGVTLKGSLLPANITQNKQSFDKSNNNKLEQ